MRPSTLLVPLALFVLAACDTEGGTPSGGEEPFVYQGETMSTVEYFEALETKAEDWNDDDLDKMSFEAWGERVLTADFVAVYEIVDVNDDEHSDVLAKLQLEEVLAQYDAIQPGAVEYLTGFHGAMQQLPYERFTEGAKLFFIARKVEQNPGLTPINTYGALFYLSGGCLFDNLTGEECVAMDEMVAFVEEHMSTLERVDAADLPHAMERIPEDLYPTVTSFSSVEEVETSLAEGGVTLDEIDLSLLQGSTGVLALTMRSNNLDDSHVLRDLLIDGSKAYLELEKMIGMDFSAPPEEPYFLVLIGHQLPSLPSDIGCYSWQGNDPGGLEQMHIDEYEAALAE